MERVGRSIKSVDGLALAAQQLRDHTVLQISESRRKRYQLLFATRRPSKFGDRSVIE
jgi:hypothetical protein